MRVRADFRRYRGAARAHASLVPLWRDRAIFVDNRTQQTPFDRHYVYHTAWAMRQLLRLKPDEHIDVGSSLYFVALASSVVPIRHFDYRPPKLQLEGLECGEGDLMSLPFPDASVASLSCMHVVEHVGLGRYGDPIDPLGDVKACKELSRVLAPEGTLLFVTPVGRPRVCFNAHRIYSFEMVQDRFPELTLKDWALVPDDTSESLQYRPSAELMNSQHYGCGCFVFQKAASARPKTSSSCEGS